ncbi:LysR family transcriptional regulator [Propionivibrio limicola]|uniref:LysR family transcriptional regulator n=1 Tax=Propionivibrio limicola TaxID=167645 RepID=UPI001290C67C|nr:LysR family transcriptional regulator [Propionivibrio limicola]
MVKKSTPPLPLLDANLLLLFELLYDTRSVTRAAEHLGLAQPTVSIWLAKLRQQLNDPLFVRTPSGMLPTPEADALIGTVRQAIDSLRFLAQRESRFDPATSERRFRICMTDASHITLLPQLLAHMQSVAPNVRLGAERIDDRIAQRLESGEADLAVGLIPELGAGFYQQSLFNQDWVCLVNPNHPRITDALGEAAYQQEKHVTIVSGTGHHLLDASLERHHLDRRVALELPGFLGLTAIISTTDLLVTLPRQIGETLAKLGGLRVFSCPIPIPGFTVKQHWHSRYHNDPGNRWLRGLCASLFMRDRSESV